MKAIILAAGRGSRLGALTEGRPKGMVELAGAPLIAYQVAALRDAGIREIALVTGYRADSILAPALTTFHNDRWAETNMVRSLQRAARWLQTDTCIVSYSDIVYSADAVLRLLSHPSDVAITFDPAWRMLWESRFGSAAIDAETFRRDSETGRLLEIGQKVMDVAAVEGQYMGLLRFTPDGWRTVDALLATLPDARVDKLDMTSLLSALLQRGQQIGTVAIADRWMEIDAEPDLVVAQALVAAQALTLPAPARDVSYSGQTAP